MDLCCCRGGLECRYRAGLCHSQGEKLLGFWVGFVFVVSVLIFTYSFSEYFFLRGGFGDRVGFLMMFKGANT